jgi:UDP-glucose 4-epimerase
MRRIVIGGAGFIGSHLAKRIVQDHPNDMLIIYDNLSSGKREFISELENNPNVKIFIANIENEKVLNEAMSGCDIVYMFASNADIAKAMSTPVIDFWQGTFLVQAILESMRINNVKKIIYASGSGIFGKPLTRIVDDNYHPMLPISTYGASKLACEALICSYCNMFNMIGRSYRFANVVGKNATHGVIKDFISKLKQNPSVLSILGDGNQNKGYIYIDDVIDGIALTNHNNNEVYDYFNLAPDDRITVSEIADIVADKMGLENVTYEYSGGLAWKGDVTDIKMSYGKALSFGWKPKYTSKQAVVKATEELLGG